MDPLLWNVHQNDRIRCLEIPTSPNDSVLLKVFAFADDVTIVCRNDHYDHYMENGLNINSGHFLRV